MNILYKLLVFILINALVLGQIRTGPAPVKIGYVGTDIAGYDDWLAGELEQKTAGNLFRPIARTIHWHSIF